jgi:hypothetical protein
MKDFKRYTLDLQLFGGEADGAVIGETGEDVAVAGQDSAENNGDEFNELINGKFKNEFTKKTQAIIDKRFKETKQLEEYKQRVSPTIDALMKKYGVAPGEEGRLAEILMKEPDENESQHKGDSYRSNLKNKISGWINESRKLKETVSDFDLRKELKSNRLFSQMLMSGMSVQSAYEAVHRDEILSDAVNITAERVRKQVVDNIQAKGMRPVENGVSSDSAVVTSVDVNSLTSQDILKILKQVENGANVRF